MVAACPDRDAFDRLADLRGNEPGSVILVLGPDVAHDGDFAGALDRLPELPRGVLEHRSVLAELEPLGQRHVERLGRGQSQATTPVTKTVTPRSQV